MVAQRSRDLHDERRDLAHHRYGLVEGDRSLLRERLSPKREGGVDKVAPRKLAATH